MKYLIPGGNDPSGFGIRNRYYYLLSFVSASHRYLEASFENCSTYGIYSYKMAAKIQFSIFKHCLQTSGLICIIKLNFNSFFVNSSFVQHMGRSWMNFSFLQQVMYTELLSTQIACLNSIAAIYFLLCLVNRLGNYST